MSVKINIEIDEQELRRLITDHLSSLTGFCLSSEDVTILVKSKQNYKAEWEPAIFKATVNKLTISEEGVN